MKLLMLCREPRLYSCQRLKQAAEALGYQMDIVDPNRCLVKLHSQQNQIAFQLYYQEGEIYDKQRPQAYLLPEYVGVLPRFGTSSTQIGCNVLRYFEQRGVAVLNKATAFSLARDKWQSLQRLATEQLPIPTTLFAGEAFEASSAVEHLASPSVIKTLSGSQGVGVILATQKTSAVSMIETLRASNIPVLLQEFIPESAGTDIRAFVIGNKVVAAMKRQSNGNEFRANIHRGGSAQAVQLTETEQQLAINATKAIGLDVAGVDMIYSASGLVVLEVNASPGLEMIEKVSKVDIATVMIQQLIK